MESVKRIIRFQNKDVKKSIIYFWMVILIADIAYYLMNLYGDASFYIGISGKLDGIKVISVVGANLMAIMVYFVVYSYVMYYETFPIAISFSVTRKDFFKSVIFNNFLVALLFALIQGILMKIDPILVRVIGREPMLDFAFFNASADNTIFIVFSLFMVNLAFVSVVNALAALNYRFGFKIWIVLGIIVFLSMLTETRSMIGNAIVDFAERTLGTRINLFQSVKFLAITAISYMLGYFFTINSNIKEKAV